jgi:BirA family transcriptional regulator, biotin operon repressor / biotin---[acetyl-CoA-carboxylase] ligase
MDIIHRHFSSIDSTNTWAKHNAHLFEHDKMTLITADEQTAGRGRFKRKWESPSGQNIYATFCFFIEKHRPDIGNIPQVLAISAAEAIEKLGFNPRLKWPNDVLLSNKKAAGILCETTPLSDTLAIIIGIGLNVNMPLDLLEKIDRPATSLFVEGGKKMDIQDVLQSLQKHFMDNLALFLDEGFSPLLAEYKKRFSARQGDRILFHDNRRVWEVAYHSINNDGSLNVTLNDGSMKTFVAGEILP